VKDGDETRHPEFEISRWAARNMTPEDRAAATVYTSGEHCPMCSASHGWVGLGRIVYAVSSAQLGEWRAGWGIPASPVAALPITAVVPGAVVDGPAPAFEEELRELHRRRATR
jgi:tRNA(Arg) A34 adenosine deaminase TadA